ncbi:MAG: hypothetical protein KKA73_13700 [Chloroflexi bacterium]|nr:hypothetical protein [Chloroflexota bacterium]MBU1748737.1 hypothetical protein [Chloroflexota bacterium]MBU1880077.1 hypothetical protein [Chloroflexota bacterium]
MHKRLMLLALLLCSCSPGLSRVTVTPSPNIEAEEYAVYSALIRQNPIGYDLGSYFAIRENTTADLDIFERTLENVHKLPSSLVDSYQSRNAASYTLDPTNLDIEQDYVLMPQEDFDQIFLQRRASWTDFEARYPGASGFILFSRVGFNADGDEALVDMGYRCGDLCGAGGLYLLVKEDGNWKVREALMVWQS